MPLHDFPVAHTVGDFVRNIADVRTKIHAAAERVGRRAAEVRLLPVSKTVPEDRVRLDVRAGCLELGENKVQEATRKAQNLADLDVRWSVIGHLQTNKARDVAAHAHEFQALESLRVAEALRDRIRVTDPTLIGLGGLSMGMSGDYEVAIEEGATCVRVGQAIFGARQLPNSHYWPGTAGTAPAGPGAVVI